MRLPAMWKLLRNFVLLFAGLLGAAKLLLWAGGVQQAGALRDLLAPQAEFAHGSASAGLDGSLHLGEVRLIPKQGAWRGQTFAAAELILHTRGALWLLTRAFSHDTSLPEQLGVEVVQPELPAGLGQALRPWLGTTGSLPFEALGCGDAAAFTAADFARMGLPAPVPRWRLDYRHDSDTHSLQIDLHSGHEPFPALHASAEVTAFAPDALDSTAVLARLRVGSLALNLADNGFLPRRNRYCAQRAGVALEAFVARHLAAVGAFLHDLGIVPAADTLAAYAQLQNGGEIELTSLPDASIEPLHYAEYVRADLLRGLNVTLRYERMPPTMLKLDFIDVPPASRPVETAVAAASPNPSAVPAQSAARPEERKPEPAPAPVAAPEPAPSAPSASATTAAATPRDEPPSPAEVATMPPKPRTLDVDPSLPASAEAPQDSTQALLWKGAVVERLPPREARPDPYVSIALDTLGSQIGRRVQLITEAQKTVEGVLAGVDANEVDLRVHRVGGEAHLRLPLHRIREARVLRGG